MSKILVNPYPESLNWENQLKATLHNHSLLTEINGKKYGSDGSQTQAEMISMWEAAGYDIACFTDHDYDQHSPNTTYPPSIFGVETSTLMFHGKEHSSGPHRNVFFCDYGKGEPSSRIHEGFVEVKNRGGLAIINHPNRNDTSIYTDSWYINMYLTHRDILVGIEVYNLGNKYVSDKLWDKINSATIRRGKVVYGFSNPDAHAESVLFQNYNMFLCNKNIESLKKAMLQGNFYFCYEPGNSGQAKAPRITNIQVNENAKTITISHDGGTVKWITNGTVQVGTGNTFNYSGIMEECDFVRAEITNEYGITGTQPFAFVSSEFKRDIKKIKCLYNNTWVDCKLRGKTSNGWKTLGSFKAKS